MSLFCSSSAQHRYLAIHPLAGWPLASKAPLCRRRAEERSGPPVGEVANSKSRQQPWPFPTQQQFRIISTTGSESRPTATTELGHPPPPDQSTVNNNKVRAKKLGELSAQMQGGRNKTEQSFLFCFFITWISVKRRRSDDELSIPSIHRQGNPSSSSLPPKPPTDHLLFSMKKRRRRSVGINNHPEDGQKVLSFIISSVQAPSLLSSLQGSLWSLRLQEAFVVVVALGPIAETDTRTALRKVPNLKNLPLTSKSLPGISFGILPTMAVNFFHLSDQNQF